MDLQKVRVAEKEGRLRLLEEVFEFTNEDLIVNKQGKLSNRQVYERRYRIRVFFIKLASFIISTIMAFIGLIMLWRMIGIVFFNLILITIIGIGLINQFQKLIYLWEGHKLLTRNLEIGKIKSVTEITKNDLTKVPPNNLIAYEYKKDGLHFEFSAEQYNVLQEGKVYTMYYWEDDGFFDIYSVEEIEKMAY